MLCYDVEGAGDDVICSPYVTASGDLFCSRCGRGYDEADEAACDEEWGWWDYNTSFDILDDNAEHGTYIGPGSEAQP